MTQIEIPAGAKVFDLAGLIAFAAVGVILSFDASREELAQHMVQAERQDLLQLLKQRISIDAVEPSDENPEGTPAFEGYSVFNSLGNEVLQSLEDHEAAVIAAPIPNDPVLGLPNLEAAGLLEPKAPVEAPAEEVAAADVEDVDSNPVSGEVDGSEAPGSEASGNANVANETPAEIAGSAASFEEANQGTSTETPIENIDGAPASVQEGDGAGETELSGGIKVVGENEEVDGSELVLSVEDMIGMDREDLNKIAASVGISYPENFVDKTSLVDAIAATGKTVSVRVA